MSRASSFPRMVGIITGTEIFLLVAIYILFIFSDQVPLFGLVALGLLWMARWWATGRLTTTTPMDLPILTILTMVAVSLYVSVDRSLSLPKFYGLILGIAVLYVVVNATHTVRGVQLAAVALILVSAAVVMLGLVGTDWPHAKTKPFPQLQLYDHLPQLIQEIPRSRKGGFSPNGIGGTLTFLMPALVSLLSSGCPSPRIQEASDGRLLQIWRAWYRPILALSLLLTAFTLALTQSRGSFIGTGVGLLALAAWHDRRALWAIPVIALAIFAVFQSGRGWELTRFVLRVDADSQTVQRRVEIWQRAIYMIRDSPHAGVGMGAFNTALKHSLTKDTGWEYVETVVAPSKPFQAIDVYLRYDDQSGTAWFDDLAFQETTQTASNASFEADSDGNGVPDHWKGINLTSQDRQGGFHVKEGNYSLKITGASGVKKRLHQRISLSGDGSQQLLLSGWSRVEGSDPDGGYHGLMAVVRYSDGTRDGFRVPFSTSRLPTQVTHAHNELLQVAVDLGIPGLVGYVALLTTFAVTAWRAYHALNDRWLRALIVGLACGMLAHQVFGLTDAFLLGTKPGVVMWVFMGLIAALYVHRDSIAGQLSANESVEAEGEGGNGLESAGGRGEASSGWLSSWPGTFLLAFGCWGLFSLLAIAVVGDQPYLGLAIALAGGVVLGLVCMKRFESKPQEGTNGTT